MAVKKYIDEQVWIVPDSAPPPTPPYWPEVRNLLDIDPPDIESAAAVLAKEEQGGRRTAELFAKILAEHRRLKPLADGLEQARRDLVDTENRIGGLLRFQPVSLSDAAEQAAAVDAAIRERSRLMNLVGESFQAVGHVAWLTQYAYALFGQPRPQRILGQVPPAIHPLLIEMKADPSTLDSWQRPATSEQPKRRARLVTLDRK